MQSCGNPAAAPWGGSIEPYEVDDDGLEDDRSLRRIAAAILELAWRDAISPTCNRRVERELGLPEGGIQADARRFFFAPITDLLWAELGFSLGGLDKARAMLAVDDAHNRSGVPSDD